MALLCFYAIVYSLIPSVHFRLFLIFFLPVTRSATKHSCTNIFEYLYIYVYQIHLRNCTFQVRSRMHLKCSLDITYSPPQKCCANLRCLPACMRMPVLSHLGWYCEQTCTQVLTPLGNLPLYPLSLTYSCSFTGSPSPPPPLCWVPALRPTSTPKPLPRWCDNYTFGCSWEGSIWLVLFQQPLPCAWCTRRPHEMLGGPSGWYLMSPQDLDINIVFIVVELLIFRMSENFLFFNVLNFFENFFFKETFLILGSKQVGCSSYPLLVCRVGRFYSRILERILQVFSLRQIGILDQSASFNKGSLKQHGKEGRVWMWARCL